ncbi:hypothetical protein Naga_100576g4 [Nannochloropsis gaditana]|uniref:Uncharacterized protein n=1 Tax=Nannochloropsis gaditana TaxID=72520 RepID=W7TLE9_9STRA|nr:hypothetical protein Naga_100576g4 [Nannochloropsis gaditana]
MCETEEGRGMQSRIQLYWRSIIFNEIPSRAQSPELQAWLERQARDTLSRWWSPGRGGRGVGVGKPDGDLDASDDKPLRTLFERIQHLSRSMRLQDGGKSTSANSAFPLRYLVEVLLEVEAEVDAALGRVPSFPPSPGPCFPHRTWRALRQVQWAFIDLFLEHVSVYRESRMKAPEVSQPGRTYPPAFHRPMSWSRVHVLDALCDLTTQWYAALKEAPTVGGLGQGEGVMIDTRQQSMVVRELSRLANTTHAAELEAKPIVEELCRLRERFQFYPEHMD